MKIRKAQWIMDTYEMFIRNCQVRVFDPTFLLCMPLHERPSTEEFLTTYINYNYVRQGYYERYIEPTHILRNGK